MISQWLMNALVDTYKSFTVDGEVDWDGQFYWDESPLHLGCRRCKRIRSLRTRVSDAPGEQVWSYFQSVDADESKRIKTDNGTRTLDDRTAIDNAIVGGEDVIATGEQRQLRNSTGTRMITALPLPYSKRNRSNGRPGDDRLEGSADSVEGEMDLGTRSYSGSQN